MNINIKKSIFCAALLISGTHISVSNSFPGGSIVSSCKGFFGGLKFSELRLPAFSFSSFPKDKGAAVSMLKSLALHKALTGVIPSLSDKIPSQIKFSNTYVNAGSSFGLNFLKKFVNEVGGECIGFAANQNKSHADAIFLMDLGAIASNSLKEYRMLSVPFSENLAKLAFLVSGKALKSVFFSKLSSSLTGKTIDRLAAKSNLFDGLITRLFLAALLKAGAEASFEFLWNISFIKKNIKNHVQKSSFVASLLPKKLQLEFSEIAKNNNDYLSASFYYLPFLHPIEIQNLNNIVAGVRGYNNSDYATQQTIGKDKADAFEKIRDANNINISNSSSNSIYKYMEKNIFNAMVEKQQLPAKKNEVEVPSA